MFLIGAVAALALGATGASMTAERALGVFPKVSDRVSGETFRTRLESMVYRVDRREAEHDCWAVRAMNDSGFPIKAK